ncbi:MAG: hypothetical protein JW896_05080 [Deltaproteobacteria bacterium]|nr:hypothetical protein [Deltaproteobacteria bacterium]
MMPLISRDKRFFLTLVRAWTGVVFLLAWFATQDAFPGDHGSPVPFQILFSGDIGGEISPLRL